MMASKGVKRKTCSDLLQAKLQVAAATFSAFWPSLVTQQAAISPVWPLLASCHLPFPHSSAFW